MNEELYFFYQEHLEYTRLYLWYQESPHALFTAQKSKVEAERYRYLSNFYWQKAVEKARQMVTK